jgi:hypothetical protein
LISLTVAITISPSSGRGETGESEAKYDDGDDVDIYS